MAVKSVQAPYQQIKSKIVSAIHEGLYGPNDKVPSENSLMQEFGVARMTAHRALRELTDEGVLTRVPGVGTFVAERNDEGHVLDVRNIADDIRARGHQYSADVILRQEEAATERLAELFQMNVGAELFRTRIVHMEGEMPLQLEDRWVNPACAPDYGDVSQEVLDYIVFNQQGTGGNEQISVSANISGELFELPAGVIGIAGGAEWREEKGWRKPDSLVQAGLALGNQEDPISGKTKAKEIYAEIHVPVLADLPLVQSLDLDAAIRYSDYDLFGGDTNYKIGMNWQVMNALKLRGTYTTAFRIPNVPELFGGVSEGNLTTTDPCSGYASLPSSSVVYQNCQAAGVPTNYVQLGNTILTDRGGNPDLQPESAKSLTLGMVLQPVEGLSFTVDYFDIEIEDAIRETPGSTKLSICYNSPNLSHVFCGTDHHTRNPVNGDINYLSTQKTNTGREVMKGIDFGAVYNFGAFGLNHLLDVNATYLAKYESTAFDGDTPFEYDGYIGGGNGGYPHWRSTASLTTSGEKWSGTYSVQMIGAGDDFNATEGPGSHMSAVFYHNIQFAYNVNDALKVSVGIDNLFQKDAPYVASWTDGNTDTMTYDLAGRRGYLRVTYKLY